MEFDNTWVQVELDALERNFDAIRETEHRHHENFARLEERLRERLPALLAMGLGPCRLCADCTWPDAPCRFPERVFPPMEAYGLSVSELCRAHGLSYYRGPTGICFTGCFLYTL